MIPIDSWTKEFFQIFNWAFVININFLAISTCDKPRIMTEIFVLIYSEILGDTLSKLDHQHTQERTISCP